MSSLLDGGFLPYVLAVGGLLLALWNAAKVFRSVLNTHAVLAYLRRNVEEGRHDKVRRFPSLAPNAELTGLVRRWLALDLEEVVLAKARGGYREAAPVVPFEQRARDALAPYVDERRARLGALLPLSAVGAALIVAGMVMGFERDGIPVLGGIGGVLVLYGGWGIRRMRRDLVDALDVLVTLHPPEPGGVEGSKGRPTRLEWVGPDGELRELSLERGIVKIGALASADVHLEGPGVSRLHAVLEVREDEVVLIDLAPGTLVDGESFDSRALAAGERITIGEHEIVAR